MKHSFKKMSAVFLSIVMLLTLAACSVPGYSADLSAQVLSENIASPEMLPTDAPTTPSTTPTEPTAASTTPTEPTAAPIPEKTKDPVFISVEEAKDLILQHLGVDSGSFREIDTDLDDREYELEVTVNDVIYDFEMDAVTGKILRKETERIVKKTETTPKETTSKETTPKETASKKSAPQLIGMDKAKQVVREHLADANAVFTDAELDDGRYEFEVYSGNMEYDYKIHATTGKILKVERERRDHDDDDCRHDYDD